MEYMRTLPDKAFSLAIVDPPYGISADFFNCGQGAKCHLHKGDSTTVKISKAKGNMHHASLRGAGKLKDRALNKFDSSWDKNPPTQEYFNELFRVSENQIIWGGNYFDLPPTRGIICWNKEQPWENFSQWEYAWTSFNMPAKLVTIPNAGFRGEHDKIHPTQKPVALYRWLLKHYARERERVLDTHVGSGSSRIACAEFGFDFVGCEIDKTYYELQEKRFKEFSDQLMLF